MIRELHINVPTPVSRGQRREDETSLNKSDAPGDFPGGSVIKASCCQCRGVGSIPGWGTKTPHALGHAKRFCFQSDTQGCTSKHRLPPSQTWGPVTPYISLLPGFSLLHSGVPPPSPREPD